ncbi:lysylphosphatidylglycerol synthase domain-containing protein [Streptomyces sp. NPDC092296]|uniref:lysylphosphatidylglycerol synthase domain-containing protein n=1 Tax=Streptomyces sp. NPDC092296 TaxID=3366012 RepID=UPI003817C92B
MTGKTGAEAGESAAGSPAADSARPDPKKVSLVKADHPTRPEQQPSGSHVSVDEPLLAARVHRPSDLIRFFAGLLGVIAVFVLANIAQNTTTGIENDITVGATKVPGFLTTVAGFLSSVAVLVVPVAFAIERLIKRDGLRVADGVLAAVLAHGVSLAIDLWVADAATQSIRNALTRIPQPGGSLTDPVHGYLSPVIAYMTAVGMVSRPRWRFALWAVVVISGGTELISGYTTPLSLVLTVLLGWTVAYGTLYTIGSPNVRPTGQSLLLGLRKVGFQPLTAHRAPAGPGDTRRYYVVQADGAPPLDVHVIDREQQASGFFYRLWRRLQLRAVAVRRSPQSLREALEQEALIAYAAAASGALAPHLVATSELGPDAAILVYEHIDGRTLDELPDQEVTDGLQVSFWESVRALHDRRIAHRRLTGESLLCPPTEPGRLINLSGGDIASGDLALRMDLAQLLTTFALRVGAERAVACAAQVLGPRRVATALPLLQPVGLSRSTRVDLRQFNRKRKAEARAAADAQVASGEKTQAEADDELAAHTGDLLARIREQVLEMVPEAPVAPVRLERLKPKTLLTAMAGAFAAYYLLTKFPAAQIDFADVDWAWVLAALAAAVFSYVAAAMSLIGFVPERLSFGSTLLAQVAGSFVKLVAPAAVGGVALNTRFLQKSGVRPVQAVASVGASQLATLASHISLLFAFGYVVGNQRTEELTPSRTVIAGLLTAAVLALVVAAVPPLRRFVATRLRSLLAGVIPRMLDLLQRPSKLVTGLGGILLLNMAFVTCLYTSIRAFGGSVGIATAAVVFLTANAVGSAVPTPGGVAAIEGALIGALWALAQVPADIATPAVLLYRILTLWLPVLPGWACFTRLQRKGVL